MLSIPLQTLPNQECSVILDNQNCTIGIRQIGGQVFLTLTVDNVKVIDSHICPDRQAIPTWSTTLFSGRLMFVDTAGKEHPKYEDFGTRFVLIYLTEDEWQQQRTL